MIMLRTPPSSSATERRRIAKGILACLLMFQSAVISAAGVAAAGSGDRRPGIDEANNGTPVINIANPNGSGLSHNLYQQFNVGEQGLILNNSRAVTTTELAGYIEGNPNLHNGSASLILNEVVNANPSSLNGYIEVGGQAADVVVANPWGITCNGCGFINSHRATLTTGEPLLHNGLLQGFAVDSGEVAIEGSGLNVDNLDRFDIIARSVELNARLNGRDINIVTGAQDVAADTLATSNGRGGAGVPEFAISSSALGGIYGDYIQLIANEHGVGVNLDAPVSAQNGDISLSSAGDITYNSLAATGDVAVEAADHQVTGVNRLFADGDISVNVGSMLNQGALIAAGDLELDADTVTNTGTLGSIDSMTIRADHISNLSGGAILSGGDPALGAGDMWLEATSILNDGADIYAGGNLAIGGRTAMPAQQVINRSGLIESGADLTLNAEVITNERSNLAYQEVLRQGLLTYRCHDCSGDNLGVTYRLEETFELELLPETTAPSSIIAGSDLTIQGSKINNLHSNIIAYADVDLNVGSVLNQGLNTGEYQRISTFYKHHDGDWHQWLVQMDDGIVEYNNRNAPYHVRYFSDGSHKDLEYMSVRRNTTNEIDPDNLMTREESIFSRYGFDEQFSYSDSEESLANANIVAGGNIDTHDAEIVNSVDGSGRVVPGLNATQLQGIATGDADQADGDLLNDVRGGLFDFAGANHPYLIETNPLFASQEGFYGSAYLLERLGWDPDGTVRLLGDGFFEQRLIRDQILEDTGRVFLDESYADNNEQYKALLDQGIYAAESMGLAIGVSLTPSQINRLQEDIVWMVEQEVAGETVLVPELYLAPGTTTTDNDGALIAAGGDITNNGGSVANSGHIEADGSLDLNLNEGGLDNLGGTLRAGETVSVRADGDILNLSGRIQSDMVELSAGGDIINRRWAERQELGVGNNDQWRTLTGKAATIEGEETFSLDAEGNILIKASDVSGGEGRLSAGENITVGTVALESGAKGHFGSGKLDQSDVRHLSSTLSSTLDLLVEAENNINIIGSDVASDQSLAVSAGEDLNVLAATNTSRYDYRARHDGETTIHKRSRTRQLSSSLNAADDLSLSSGGNMLAVASEFDAGRNLSLTSDGDMALLAANDSDYSYTYEEDDKWYGSKASVSESYSERVVATELEAENDLLINTRKDAEGNIRVFEGAEGNLIMGAVHVETGGDSAVYSGRDLLVAAEVEQTHHHSETRREYKSAVKGFASVAGATLASIGNAIHPGAGKEVNFQLAGDSARGQVNRKVIDSRFDSGGDTLFLAGNEITFMGGELDPHAFSVASGLNEDSEGGIKLLGVQAEQRQYNRETTMGFGGDMDGGVLSFSSKKDREHEYSSRKWHGTEINVDNGIRFSSAGDLVTQGSVFEGSGDLVIDVNGKIRMNAGVSGERTRVASDEEGDLGAYRRRSDELGTSHSEVTRIDMDGDFIASSVDDQFYQGTRIENSGDQLFRSEEGGVHFQTVRDTRYQTHERESSDNLWMSGKVEGSVDEQIHHVVLNNDGERTIDAAEGVYVDLEHVNGTGIGERIDAMIEADPEITWLTDMEMRDDVEWQTVREKHDAWSEDYENLSEGGALAVSVLVTAATGGVGSGLANTVRTVAGEGFVGAGLGAATQAGFQSAVTQTGIGTINNGGKFDRALSDLGRNDSLDGIGAGMLTAGLTTSVVDPAYDLAFDDIRTDNIYGVTKGFDLASFSGAAGFTAHAGTQALTQAAVNDLIHGGSFAEHLKDSLEQGGNDVLSALAFNWTGEVTSRLSARYEFAEQQGLSEVLGEGGWLKTASHTLVGGYISEAIGGDFKTGAASAGLSQITTTEANYSGDTNEGPRFGSERGWGAARSELAGVLGAALVEGDLNEGQWIAKQGYHYNARLHPRGAALLDEAREKVSDLPISDSEKERRVNRLVALACAAKRCSAGVPDQDPLKERLAVLEEAGQSMISAGITLKEELRQYDLSVHQEMGSGRSRSMRNVFAYTPIDWLEDSASKNTGVWVDLVGYSAETLYQGASAGAVNGLAGISWSDHFQGFGDYMYAQFDERQEAGFSPLSGQSVVDSFSGYTYDAGTSYLGSLTLAAASMVPIAKVGKSADRLYQAFNGKAETAKYMAIASSYGARTWNEFQPALKGLGLNSTIMSDLWKPYKALYLDKASVVTRPLLERGALAQYEIYASGGRALTGYTFSFGMGGYVDGYLNPSLSPPVGDSSILLLPWEIGSTAGSISRITGDRIYEEYMEK
jgi:filamentous hemagglutinin family protein